MAKMIDKMLVVWSGATEIEAADRFRRIVAARSLNATIKRIIADYVSKHAGNGAKR